ncbi:hypothetical protein GCK32_016863 [Trichostrongylus colubriformis]|uniref:R3H domain-containing protein n=1 Tax=Trichostrongylus colubriformis TaxID=6319 RepID=A0AAN8IAZ4_TRICO
MKVELRTNAAFVIEVEKTFLELLEKIGDPTFLGSSVNHNFRPMSVDKRRFIHEYAAFFSIETVGVDDPPKRSVIATAKRGVSRAPLVLLTSLQKYPNMLKVAGSVTLKSSFNDEPKRKGEQTAEEASNAASSMKALRGGRVFKKRVAPQIARPSPLPQFNHFAVLNSDDEESDSQVPTTQVTCEKKEELLEKDPNWWSDEEDEVNSSDEACKEIAAMMEELVLRVCKTENCGECVEQNDASMVECKDSWSDEE